VKTKFPRADAIAVARELVAALRSAAPEDRLVVAGSLRRRKREVGDVEVLFVPNFIPERDGLFDTRQVNLADRVLDRLLEAGVLARRKNSLGGEAWGEKNKLAVHRASGIPVDLFTAREGNWFNLLVCRTGSAESNVRIAAAAKAKGWKWNPYGPGFTDQAGLLVQVLSERAVFELIGLPYLEPWQRNLS
jgi:DNA polymerase/3'-5' exonuclease PolX